MVNLQFKTKKLFLKTKLILNVSLKVKREKRHLQKKIFVFLFQLQFVQLLIPIISKRKYDDAIEKRQNLIFVIKDSFEKVEPK